MNVNTLERKPLMGVWTVVAVWVECFSVQWRFSLVTCVLVIRRGDCRVNFSGNDIWCKYYRRSH